MKALQFDADSNQLMRRSALEKAHFGTLSRAEACAAAESALAGQLCRDLEEYSLVVPAAAEHGTTSLVRYEFLPGYGCLDTGDLVGDDTVLSRRAAPNRVVSCPSVANGKALRRDSWTCGIDCQAGFRLEGGVCVSSCAGLNETCAAGFYAAETCQEGARTLYRCEPCGALTGHGAAAWRAAQADVCQYEVCAAGTHSVGLQCVACGANTYSNASGAAACFSCETLASGLYQRQTGKTACEACLWKEEAAVCEPGAAAALSWSAVERAFETYNAHEHAVQLADFYTEYCTSGQACLPCAPGYISVDGRACVACEHAFYQPNIGSVACYPCEANQNTSSVASTRASECICDPGHE
jgi:hypothetical protein